MYKGITLAALAIFASASLSHAQSDAQSDAIPPRVSPRAQVSQTIGISTVTIDYHRPSVKGRSIWGSLVPYGAVWRAGANENTTITLSDDATIDGQALAAGTYGLHMIPSNSSWIIIFSNDSASWGSFSYDQSKDALRIEVTPVEAPAKEQLAYEFDAVNTEEATLSLRWEKLRVPVKIHFDTTALAAAAGIEG